MTVQLDKNNRVRQPDPDQEPRVQVVRPTADTKMTPDEATQAALRSLDNPTLRQAVGQLRDPLSHPQGIKLAYIMLIPTREPVHDWRMVVDAYTGEVLAKEDLVLYFPDGQGLARPESCGHRQ